MLYKPKFCCQCGEQIERVDWKLWSSRRFCEFCETEIGHHDWMPRIVLGLGIVLSIFGLGNYFLTPESSSEFTPRQVVRQTRQTEEHAVKTDRTQKQEQTFNQNSVESSKVEAPVKQINDGAKKVAARDKQAENFRIPQDQPVETVYFCGAETKKGTPCSRRVKGGGRCWQHTGREAMLPEEELIVNR